MAVAMTRAVTQYNRVQQQPVMGYQQSSLELVELVGSPVALVSSFPGLLEMHQTSASPCMFFFWLGLKNVTLFSELCIGLLHWVPCRSFYIFSVLLYYCGLLYRRVKLSVQMSSLPPCSFNCAAPFLLSSSS